MHLLIFGLGYCGTAVADAAHAAGFTVTGTLRQSDRPATIPFDAAAPIIAAATHVLSTVPPNDHGDPVVARYADVIAAAPRLRWIGYLSSTVVYGDRGADGWTRTRRQHQARSEATAASRPKPAWGALAGRRPVDIFRLAGIYGPGRSAFDDLRAGRARRIVKPGHTFGRIHRDDIAGAVLAAMRQDPRPDCAC